MNYSRSILSTKNAITDTKYTITNTKNHHKYQIHHHKYRNTIPNTKYTIPIGKFSLVNLITDELNLRISSAETHSHPLNSSPLSNATGKLLINLTNWGMETLMACILALFSHANIQIWRLSTIVQGECGASGAAALTSGTPWISPYLGLRKVLNPLVNKLASSKLR